MSKHTPNTTAQAPIVEPNPDAAPWDHETDVLVIGFGGAGACAALQACEEGARVDVLERFGGGGATAISGGVFYGGGGTHIQHQAGVEDSVDAMFNYLAQEVKDAVCPETLRDFCEQSVPNLQWLERHGVPFEGSLCPYKTSYPLDTYYLYYSGNEGFSPYKDTAKPAPRGHRAKGKGLPGASFYEPLRQSVHQHGAHVHYQAHVTRLITDSTNNQARVIGVEYTHVPPGLWATLHQRLYKAAVEMVKYNPAFARSCREGFLKIEAEHSQTKRIRAHGGVILSAGGFIYNRDMVKQHAPHYRKGMPLGTPGDNGSGICLGQSVGGATARMERISAWRFINPPPAFAQGMLVNHQGERYINERMYGAAIGEAMVEEQQGSAILIIDQALKDRARAQCRPGEAQWFQRAPALLNLWFNARRADNLDALATMLHMPVENLQRTLTAYNQAATGQQPDAFNKAVADMHPMPRGPYYAIDCAIDSQRFPCPTLTLGGLVIDEHTGAVKNNTGDTIPGLYAAGRNAVGVCSQQYVSGLSIADCVYSGRRAGRSVAHASHR